MSFVATLVLFIYLMGIIYTLLQYMYIVFTPILGRVFILVEGKLRNVYLLGEWEAWTAGAGE